MFRSFAGRMNESMHRSPLIHKLAHISVADPHHFRLSGDLEVLPRQQAIKDICGVFLQQISPGGSWRGGAGRKSTYGGRRTEMERIKT